MVFVVCRSYEKQSVFSENPTTLLGFDKYMYAYIRNFPSSSLLTLISIIEIIHSHMILCLNHYIVILLSPMDYILTAMVISSMLV